jgi:hypothetical protein
MKSSTSDCLTKKIIKVQVKPSTPSCMGSRFFCDAQGMKRGGTRGGRSAPAKIEHGVCGRRGGAIFSQSELGC